MFVKTKRQQMRTLMMIASIAMIGTGIFCVANGSAAFLAVAFVIGLVLAAIYVKNESLLQVVAVHFLIDLTTRIFMEHPSYASPMQLVVFVLVLAVEAVYALWLTVKRPGSGETK